MAMTHTMKYFIEREISIPGMDDHDWQEVELRLEYSWTPGVPEQGPTYACGGQPAEPPEINDLVAYDLEGGKVELTDDEEEKAARYIAEEHEG